MARSRNRSGNRGSNGSSRASQNRDDWSGGVMELARERPVAAAAVAAGAAAAGLFLWSRRSQISTHLSSLSEQIGEWTENMGGNARDTGSDDTAGLATSRPAQSQTLSSSQSGTRQRRGMSETGGGTALDATSGGGGSLSSASGRSRAGATTPQQ